MPVPASGWGLLPETASFATLWRALQASLAAIARRVPAPVA